MSYNIKNVQTEFSNLIKGFKIIIMKIERKKHFYEEAYLALFFTLLSSIKI